MIKKLQHKFIAISVLSVFLVLTVIMGAINILNYNRIVNSSDSVLEVLRENGGSFPKLMGFDRRERRRDNWFLNDESAEMPYETRFFTVRLNGGGNVTSVDTGRIAAIDTDDARTYAESLWKSGRTKGFVDQYRFLRTEDGDDTLLIFLDCRNNLSSFRSFLFYSVIVSLAGMGAVAVLVVLLSRMVMRPVQESYDKQKSFITDAGHEIKTPLTIIDADASILETELGEDNEWIQDIHAQVRRLTALTKDLIYLSRMEEQAHPVQMIEFPLSDVLNETAQSFQALAKVQGKTFQVDVAPMMSYCGDEKAIRQLVSILLDNALKYSDAHGTISLTAKPAGNKISIQVFNTADHVERNELHKLFDRFYRAEKSRNSQTGGYGIGLSIARAVVEAHKGSIAATTRDSKSLCMTVTL